MKCDKLKDYDIMDIEAMDDERLEKLESGKIQATRVYIKSEADKVIADLKNEIEIQKRLRDMALASVPNVLKVMKIIQHHKYKRCLAMASKCRLRARWFGDNAFYKKEQWALQWHKRWIKIAEQFKEAK